MIKSFFILFNPSNLFFKWECFPRSLSIPTGHFFQPNVFCFVQGNANNVRSHNPLEMIKRERFLMCTSFRTGISVAWRTTTVEAPLDSVGLFCTITIKMSHQFVCNKTEKNGKADWVVAAQSTEKAYTRSQKKNYLFSHESFWHFDCFSQGEFIGELFIINYIYLFIKYYQGFII